MSTPSEQVVTIPKTEKDAPKPPRGVFKRLASKLRNLSQSGIHDALLPSASDSPSAQLDGHAQDGPPLPPFSEDQPAEKMKRKTTRKLLSLPSLPQASKNSPLSASGMYASLHHDINNDWSSATKREAALRASGLVPSKPKPGRDLNGYRLPLSELETELDDKYAVLVDNSEGDSSSPEKDNEDSEAKRIREEWLRRNKEHEAEERLEDQGQEVKRGVSEELDQPNVREHVHELKTRTARGKGRTSSIDSAHQVFHDAQENLDEENQDYHDEPPTNTSAT